jgi:hypothetical protein
MGLSHPIVIFCKVNYSLHECPTALKFALFSHRLQLRLLWDAQQWFEARRIVAGIDVPYTGAPKPANASGEASVH